jgi:hypothetical protein
MPEPDTHSDARRAKIEAKLAGLSPDERAKLDASLEEISTVGQAIRRYQKDLLRRLGVRTDIDDFEELYVQLLAAAEYVGLSPERFWEMTPRELCAVLEHRATELQTLRCGSQSGRAEPQSRTVENTSPKSGGAEGGVRAGAPVKKTTAAIQARWAELNRPKRSPKLLDAFGEEFYPAEFAKAKPGSSARKKLRDKIWATMIREHRSATKPIS